MTPTLGYSTKLFKFTNYLLYIYISMNDERFNSCGHFFLCFKFNFKAAGSLSFTKTNKDENLE